MTSSTRTGLLAGIKILDFSRHLSGPYGTMMLADMGADVIKIEPLSGDPVRGHIRIDGDAEFGLVFGSVNRNKRSIAVDLKSPEGDALVRRLVAETDIVYTNLRPGAMDRLGLGFDALCEVNPTVVYVSLTGYGMTGPRSSDPAFDLAIQALSGGMSVTGMPGGPPVRAGIPISDLCGGMSAALGALAGLAYRDRARKPVLIDLSLLDTQVSMLAYWGAMALNTNQIPGPQGSGNSHIIPYGAVQTADGHIAIAPYDDSFWRRLCIAAGLQHLIDDPRFLTNELRVANKDQLAAILGSTFKTRTSSEWIKILVDGGVPASPINNIAEALADPQITAREMLTEVAAGSAKWKLVGDPIKSPVTSDSEPTPPPRLGEHTRSVLHELGISLADINHLVETGVVKAAS